MELTIDELIAYWQTAAETAHNELMITRLENDSLRREIHSYVDRCAHLREQLDALKVRMAAAVAR